MMVLPQSSAPGEVSANHSNMHIEVVMAGSTHDTHADGVLSLLCMFSRKVEFRALSSTYAFRVVIN